MIGLCLKISRGWNVSSQDIGKNFRFDIFGHDTKIQWSVQWHVYSCSNIWPFASLKTKIYLSQFWKSNPRLKTWVLAACERGEIETREMDLGSKNFARKGIIILESLFRHDVLKIPSKVGSKCAYLRASRAAQSCSFFALVLYRFSHRSFQLFFQRRRAESEKMS
jgi:hypothetical protein